MTAPDPIQVGTYTELAHQPTITIARAREILTPDEFSVWLTKHIAGKGRRTGSLALGITEDAWRYRLQQADIKIARELEETA